MSSSFNSTSFARKLIALALLLGIYGFNTGEAMAAVHPVPKNSAQLQGGEWFPYVVSKLAPLEWWNFAESISDIKADEFPGNMSFQLARQNTWEFPRFCFSLFRPTSESYKALVRAVEQYQGGVVWVMHDDCIGAMAARPTFFAPILSEEGMKALKKPCGTHHRLTLFSLRKLSLTSPLFALTWRRPSDYKKNLQLTLTRGG